MAQAKQEAVIINYAALESLREEAGAFFGAAPKETAVRRQAGGAAEVR